MSPPSPDASSPSPVPAGLLRRLAAAGYDAMLLASILFVATVPIVALAHGQAVRPHQPLYVAYLATLVYAYFGWSWTRGGQTLGMRAWRIAVRAADGGDIGWGRAGLRLAAACLSWALAGLGYLALLVDPQRRTLHDRLSGTRVVVVPKPG